MTERMSDKATFGVLRAIFSDQPDLLSVVTLHDMESGRLLQEVQRSGDLFSAPVKLYTVGRTGAGKTSLGNGLFGEEAMRSTGHMDCTSSVGLLRLRSKLWFLDTPGAGSSEEYENYTRLALGLPQRHAPRVDTVPLDDYTESTLGPGGVEGVLSSRLSAGEWTGQFAREFAPDTVVYVVAPRMGFSRDDRVFLADMLDRHGRKLVVALNTWRSDDPGLARIQLDDVREQVRRVFADVLTGDDVQPRFVELDVRTGSGVHDLAAQLCRIVAPEKLGRVQTVLSGELRHHAEIERSRRYRQTVHRIAARLALHTVDQRHHGEDLVGVAATGISHYGVLIFEAAAAADRIRDELWAHVESRVAEVKRERSRDIVATDVQTARRDLVEREPIIEMIETMSVERQVITRTVEEMSGKGVWETVKVWGSALGDHLGAVVDGTGRAGHDAARRRMREGLVDRTTREVAEEVDVPVRRLEQRVVDYRTRVVDTVTEVVGTTEQVVGTTALAGGVPVIELLLAVGRGVEEYCLRSDADRGALQEHVERERDGVRLVLDRDRGELAGLIDKGSAAEPAIAALLDRAFGADATSAAPAGGR